MYWHGVCGGDLSLFIDYVYSCIFLLPKSFSNKLPLDSAPADSIGGWSGVGWWVSKWVACRRQWSRSSRRSPVVCSRWLISRSRCLIFSSKSSVLESLCGVSSRSVSVFGGYTRKSSTGSICHWFLSSLVALNRPPLIASRMVDFCFPVAFAACPRVYGKSSVSFGLSVLPTIRSFRLFVKAEVS